MSGCANKEQEKAIQQQQQNQSQENIVKTNVNTPLLDDRNVYLMDDEVPLVFLYVTVVKDADRPATFYDINHPVTTSTLKEDDQPTIKIIVQEGTASGPQKGYFGYGTTVENATLRLRGQSSRFQPQKSYKIKLMNRAGLWKNQEVLNLNKHPFDATRIRNKLSFDYLREIPNMTSLRTEFVHLFVKDLTSTSAADSFEDYGLYTHVEQPNKRFLGSHGLDPSGYLYKPKFFEFLRYENELKDVQDPQYNKKWFESILEIKGREDHRKLIKMLDDINNPTAGFDQIFDQHFNRDNYLTWIGTNILFGNIDTRTQNFYLYSPLNNPKWYFLPWDYDGAWGKYEDDPTETTGQSKWEVGISNYWGSTLHQRFFKNPNNVVALTKKINELRKIVTPDKSREKLDRYYPVVSSFVKQSPDLNFLPIRIEDYDFHYRRIANETEENYQKYLASLENPMPFFLGTPKKEGTAWVFLWDTSYDLQNDDLTYDFQISKDPQFVQVVFQQSNLMIPKSTVKSLPAGTYYWRAFAKDEKGNTQVAFDNFDTEDGQRFEGIQQIKIR